MGDTPEVAAAYADGFADGAIFFASSVESFRARAELMDEIRAKIRAAIQCRDAAPTPKEPKL